MTESNKTMSINDKIMRLEKRDNSMKRSGLRQATLRWPTEDRGEKRERDSNNDSETREEMQREPSKDDETTWVRGGKEDDNQRYRDFLKYCEEKREERKGELEIDRSRKEDALRACIETIKDKIGQLGR